MTTPQRALGTLEFLQGIARKLDPHFPAPVLSDDEKAAACQALYHYAEIMQAEAVAISCKGGGIGWLETGRPCPKTGTKLIIKPKPLP